MTITILWWHPVLFFLVVPFLYAMLRKDGGDWDMHIDTFMVFGTSWMLAIGIVIGHFT